MKNIIIAIILLLAVGETHAQKWFTPASKWYFTSRDITTNEAFEISKQKDTIINNKTCVKFTTRSKSAYTQQWSDVGVWWNIIVHNDTIENKQYLVSKGKFYVMYDFNKTIGDTIFIPRDWPFSQEELDSGAWSIIDSIGIDTIMGTPYKTMHYTQLLKPDGKSYDWTFEGKIIEGIGNIYTPLPGLHLGFNDMGHPRNLRCFENETINLKLFDLPCDTSINYVSVKEIFDDKSVTIFPNPFNENLSVDLSKLPQTEVSIIFLNNIGQTILTQSAWTNHIINISTSNFNAGIYLCKIKVLDRILTYRIIKP